MDRSHIRLFLKWVNESVNSAAAKGNVDVDDCRAGELENYNSDYSAELK